MATVAARPRTYEVRTYGCQMNVQERAAAESCGVPTPAVSGSGPKPVSLGLPSLRVGR